MIRTVSGLGSLTRLSLESPLSRRTVGAVDFFLALAAAAATAASVSAADDDACCCARRATGDDDDAAAILCAGGGRLSSVFQFPVSLKYLILQLQLISCVANHQPSKSSSDPCLSMK